MSLTKKILGVALATGLAAASFAGGPVMGGAGSATASDLAATHNGGFTVGGAWVAMGGGELDNTKATPSVQASLTDGFALQLGFVNAMFLADLNATISHHRVNNGTATNSLTAFPLGIHLGLRHNMLSNLYLTYGVAGRIAFFGSKTTNQQYPWAVGAFAGLDWQPLAHLLVSFKLQPFTYERSSWNSTTNVKNDHFEFFEDGTFSMSYVF